MNEFSNGAYRDLLFKLTPEDFFHIMSHDLRAPLANIVGALSLLKDHPQSPLSDDDYQNCVTIIEQSTQQLDTMILGALEYGHTLYTRYKSATQPSA